ncbi:hypothetical protein BGX31_001951 [Mortierella sp. GBA43]|nr:hypothetical protein BGX31_001951 [Mortierella sp. GBA43]
MAANPMWDGATRQSAIAFLGEMYKNDEMWGQHSDINRWIINILTQVVASTSGSSGVHAIAAEGLLKELESGVDVKNQEIYPLKLSLSLPELGSPSLLDRVQNRQDVEFGLRMLRKQRTMDRGVAVYVPPQAKNGIQASDETRFPLMERVQEFLGSERKVFLLLGDSGAGKSTFTRELDFQLWQSYERKTGRIPLHINLPTIEKPEHDMVAKQLRKSEFTEPQIREMKHHRKFILICDGYDESQQIHNLYMSNRLNQPGEWDVQMVISCRSEYVGADYRDRFQPRDRNKQFISPLFQEAVITPFSIDQVRAYIQQYVSTQQPLWRVEDYTKALDETPSLKELVKNPFLMALSLEVLPRMVDPDQKLSGARATRVVLYDHFIEQWLERSKKRLGEKDLSPQARDEFERLSAEGFTRNGIGYLKKLAVAMYKEQDGHPVVEYSQSIDEGTWKDNFFRFKDKQLLHEACPITRSGNQHRFIHRSILEYGLARSVFDPRDGRNVVASGLVMNRRGSMSSALSIESQDETDDEAVATKQDSDFDSPLVWRNFVNDSSLLNFLEEIVQQEPLFKTRLLSYIEHSKIHKKWRKAAANAITILVRAGVQFNGADLRGIQIPGANLSFGVFDSTQFQEANLRNVNFRGAWLRHADLSRSQMAGVQFGEQLYLSEESAVVSCSYSPDGSTLSVSLESGYVSVYTTLPWKKVQSSLNSGGEPSMLPSPSGNRIMLTGCGTVPSMSREYLHLLLRTFSCVAYSPQGSEIASAGQELIIWDSGTGERLKTLHSQDEDFSCLAYSPDGGQIVSGSSCGTVKLWDVAAGVCSGVLSGHQDWIQEVTCSPRQDQVASASRDGTIRLWDTRTFACIHILSEQVGWVYCIRYSPKGDKLVSGHDKTVRLWDVGSGVNQHTFFGHNGHVTSVACSPRGDQIASGGDDHTVRLWDVSAAASSGTSYGYTGRIRTIQCSPGGDVIITSGDKDDTIRLWDAETGSHCQTLRGHTGSVDGVAIASISNFIASCSSDDRTLRMWDVEKGVCDTYGLSYYWDIAIAITPQGSLIACTSKGCLWNVGTRKPLATLEDCGDHVPKFFTFSPCFQLIAFRSRKNVLRLWYVNGDESTFEDHQCEDEIQCIKFSPQGTQIAVGISTMDHVTGTAITFNVVRLLDVKSGTSEHTMTGHSDRISCIAYSVKGDLVASGSDDKTVRVWDVASGQCRVVIPCCSGKISGICWRATSDTNNLAVGCENGSILMWKLTEDGDSYRTDLQWGNLTGALVLEGLSIQDIRGLSQLNKELLKQRGAQTLDPITPATTTVPDEREPKRRRVERNGADSQIKWL